MKTTKTIVALATATALAAGMLSGCAGAKADAETAANEADHAASLNTYVADDVEMDVMLHEAVAAIEEIAPEAVVEVVDEDGNTVQMTAAEAKASGRQVVSGGASAPAASSQGGSAPAASVPSAPSAPSHQHSWGFVVTQSAWDETTYKTVTYCQCNGCGADITDNPGAHMEAAGRGSKCGSWRTATKQVAAGVVHHEAQGYYACACGATK